MIFVNYEHIEKSVNGIVFIFISLSALSATLLGHIIDLNVKSLFLDIIIWVGCFFMFAILFKGTIIQSLHIIRNKIRKSTAWSPSMRLINGLCWAAPFGLGALIPSLHEYLILAGIG